MAILSQAGGGLGSPVGAETRQVTPKNTPALRAPRNSHRVEDIVQAGRKLSGNLLVRRDSTHKLMGLTPSIADSLMEDTTK